MCAAGSVLALLAPRDKNQAYHSSGKEQKAGEDQVSSLGLWLQLVVSYELKYSCSTRHFVAAQITGCLAGRFMNYQCRGVTRIQISFQLVAWV